jgi:rSAM/selenodomain-associated transferase 2
MMPNITIVMPVLNEANILQDRLSTLQAFRNSCKIIVTDGGSRDESIAIAQPLSDQIIHSPRSRARQMNGGAKLANTEILLFLHADIQLPLNAFEQIIQAIGRGFHWGRFDVCFDSPRPIFKLIAFMMNARSRLTGIATGDQAMFVTKSAFEKVSGFPDIPLMEDIALSQRLKKLGPPACLKVTVMTSARRWQRDGIFTTILLMWRLRLCYFFGANPENLAKQYYK